MALEIHMELTNSNYYLKLQVFTVPSIYSVRVAIFAFKSILINPEFHAYTHSTHLHLSTEIISLKWPIETMIIGSDDINGRYRRGLLGPAPC